VLAVIAAFTLQVCLMAAAAFTLEQSVEWVVEVAQSVAMQLLVTGPAVDLVLFLLKLFISLLLLRVGRRRQFVQQRKALNVQAARLAKRESSVAGAASAASARVEALKVVATGDERAVKAARAVQMQAKNRHEARLADVIAAKTRLVGKVVKFKQQHPAAALEGTASLGETVASGPPRRGIAHAAAAAALKQMWDEKLKLDADERRTVMLLNAVRVSSLWLTRARTRVFRTGNPLLEFLESTTKQATTLRDRRV
jgi:membrane protein implicated in regulation of membrane protease activity